MKKTQKDEFLSSRVRYIPINTVRPNPQQPRRSFDETALRELADSIRAYGILQPLTVRDRGGFYELVAGERRLRAARIAGLREVPCLVAEVGEEDAALLALIEKIFRDYKDQTTVHYENKPTRNALHPTMKPIPLVGRLMNNSSRPGWAVGDFFGGSGTTLIAAEQLGRTAYLMEYDPRNADVIVQRWEQFTGERAVLVNG